MTGRGKSGAAAFLATAALATALFAGCGSGDSSEATISKEAFVKQANAICTAAKKEGRKQTPEEGSFTVAAILQIEVDGIEALDTPAEGAESVEEILEEARAAIKIIESEQENMKKARENARKAAPHFLKAEEIAFRYGIDSCLVA